MHVMTLSKNKFFHLLILPFLLVFSNSLKGQKVISFVGKGRVYAQKIHGDYLYMMLGADNAFRSDLYRVKLPNGEPEPLDTAIYYGQSVRMTDSGIFYISFKYDANGNDGRHFLHYFSFSKNAKVFSKEINLFVQHPNRTKPSSPNFINNKFYISAFYNNNNCIWESDGTESGTKIILKSELDLSYYQFFLNKPIVISYFGNDQILLDHNNKQIFKYKATALNKLAFFHNSNDVCILSMNGRKLIRVTEQYQIDSLSFAIKGFRTFYVSYSNDSMITGYNQVSGKPYTFNLKIVPPFTYDSVPPSQFLQSIGKTELDKTNRQFMSIWSMKHGVEMAFAPRFDSIRLIKDLFPGYNSGIRKIQGTQFDIISILTNKNMAYFIGSNGSDKKYYVYSTDGISMKSHFPIDISRDMTQLIGMNDRYIVWSYFIQDSLFIENRNLYQIDSQPPFKYFKNDNHSKDGEWLRTVTKVSTNSQFFDWGISKTIYSNAVKSDKFGNVFTSASFKQSSGYGYYYLLHSDTNVFHQIKGDKFIVKYDSLGNLLWNFSFGNYKDWNQENYGFDIDNQGDVIVSSKYLNDLFLDTLNLKSNLTKFYAFKLNGKTGKLIWVNEFLVSSSFSLDHKQKITIDNEDNIYVSFLFSNGIANIGSIQLNSNLSPANAILKIDKDGNNIWAKCTETPWNDKYGSSRDMVYDSVNQCVYDLIGQGAYNWISSCKYSDFRSIVHKINKDGEFTEVQKIEGDDLNGSTVMTTTKNNSIFVSGFYRGDLSMAPFSLRSLYDKNIGCNKWEEFHGTINVKNGEALNFRGSPNSQFYPFDICSDNRYVYILGCSPVMNERFFTLGIRRYTHFGRLVGKRNLKDCYSYDPFDFNNDYNIDLNGNSHFIISMNSNASRISPFDNFIPNYEGFSVYRLLKDLDWIEEPPVNEKEVLSGIVVSPNPASDQIQLQFNNPLDYSKLFIYNAVGQLVLKSDITSDIYQTISISQLSGGIYTLQIQGKSNFSTKIMVR